MPVGRVAADAFVYLDVFERLIAWAISPNGLLVLATLFWTSLLVFTDIRQRSKTRAFLGLSAFYLYFCLHLTAAELAAFIWRPAAAHMLPDGFPLFGAAVINGLLGSVLGVAFAQFSFQPVEGVDLGIEKFFDGLRLTVVESAIEAKAHNEKMAATVMAEMIAMSTADLRELEEKFLEVVGDTVGDPSSKRAQSARDMMARYKEGTPLRYPYHLARAIANSDIHAAKSYFRKLLWLKADAKRYPRWFFKGVLMGGYMTATL